MKPKESRNIQERILAGEAFAFGDFSGAIPVFKYRASPYEGVAGDLQIRDEEIGIFRTYCPASLGTNGLLISFWFLGVEHMERFVPLDKILFRNTQWISWPIREAMLADMQNKMNSC